MERINGYVGLQIFLIGEQRFDLVQKNIFGDFRVLEQLRYIIVASGRKTRILKSSWLTQRFRVLLYMQFVKVEGLVDGR